MVVMKQLAVEMPYVFQNDEVIGSKIRFKAVKQRFDSPFKERMVDLTFGKGFDPVNDLVNKAIELNIIKKNGSWFGFEDKNLCQGKESLVSLLKESEELKNKIYKLVMSQLCQQK